MRSAHSMSRMRGHLRMRRTVDARLPSRRACSRCTTAGSSCSRWAEKGPWPVASWEHACPDGEEDEVMHRLHPVPVACRARASGAAAGQHRPWRRPWRYPIPSAHV